MTVAMMTQRGEGQGAPCLSSSEDDDGGDEDEEGQELDPSVHL